MKAEYINTTRAEVESGKFNIFIGISLGNLFFSGTNLREYIRWALDNTCEKVAILIADEIQAINYQVFKGLSKKDAILRAKEQGLAKEKLVKKLVKEIGDDDKIVILHWKDILSKEYKKKIKITFEEFGKNPEFREEILSIISGFVDGKGEFSKEEKVKLAEYVLNELALLIEGLKFEEDYFEVLPYPLNDSFDNLILRIQNGEKFQEYARKLNLTGNRKIVVLR